MKTILENVWARPLEFSITVIVFLAVLIAFILIVFDHYSGRASLVSSQDSLQDTENAELLERSYDERQTIRDWRPAFDFENAARLQSKEDSAKTSDQFMPSSPVKPLSNVVGNQQVDNSTSKMSSAENTDKTDSEPTQLDSPLLIASGDPEAKKSTPETDLPTTSETAFSNLPVANVAKIHRGDQPVEDISEQFSDIPLIHVGQKREKRPSVSDHSLVAQKRSSALQDRQKALQDQQNKTIASDDTVLKGQFQSGIPMQPSTPGLTNHATTNVGPAQESLAGQFNPEPVKSDESLTTTTTKSFAPNNSPRHHSNPVNARRRSIQNAMAKQGFHSNSDRQVQENTAPQIPSNQQPGSQRVAKRSYEPADARLRHSTLFNPNRKRKRFGFGF